MEEVVTITWQPDKVQPIDHKDSLEFKHRLLSKLKGHRYGLLAENHRRGKKDRLEGQGSFWLVRATLADDLPLKDIGRFGVFIYRQSDAECLEVMNDHNIPDHLESVKTQDNQGIIEKLLVINKDLSLGDKWISDVLDEHLPKPVTDDKPKQPPLISQLSTDKDEPRAVLTDFDDSTPPSPVEPVEVEKKVEKVEKVEKAESTDTPDIPLTKPTFYTRAGFDKLQAIDTTSKYFVPGKVNAVFGDAGIGKTGLFLHWVITELLREGNEHKKATIISRDMSIEEFRPFLHGYGNKEDLDNRIAIFSESDMVLERDLLHHIEEWKPDIIVADTFDTWLEECESAFMPPGTSFDVKVAGHWVLARAWLTNIITKNNIAFLAILHVPLKSNPFLLPHSSKLKGLLFRTWLLVAKSCEKLIKWGQQDIAAALRNEPDGTVCLYPDKQRCGDEKDKIPLFFNFNVKIDPDKLNKDDQFIPCGVSKPREVERGMLSDEEEPKKKSKLTTRDLTPDFIVEWIQQQKEKGKKTMPQNYLHRVFEKNPTFNKAIEEAIKTGVIIHEGYGPCGSDGIPYRWRYRLPEPSELN